MIKLKLNRFICTNKYTLGMLEEETTGFRCYTKERPCNDNGYETKVGYCLPEGTYTLRLDADGLKMCFSISARGIYRHAGFTYEDLSKTHTGCVMIGTSYVGGELLGSQRAYDALCKLTEKLWEEGAIKRRGRCTDALLIIERDVNADHYEVDDEDEKEEKEDFDWDLIDED